MNVFVYKLIGYVSLAIGLAAALCIFNIRNIYLGVALSIPGFLLSGINIYLNTKYYFEEERYPKGYLGMLFSSLPVLFLLFVIFRFKN